MRIPIKLLKDPVAEVVLEFRFTTSVPDDAVFGVFYNALKDIFPEYQTLPSASIPDHVKANDPKLRFTPFYSLVKGNYQLNIGPRVIALVTKEPYCGWDVFYGLWLNIFESLQQTTVINSVVRLGMRYINFFPFAIFPHLNLGVSTPFSQKIVAKHIVLHHKEEECNTRMIIADNISQNKNGVVQQGSIVDLDTFIDGEFSFDESLNPLVSQAHAQEKECFYSLLQPEFLESLGPVYTSE